MDNFLDKLTAPNNEPSEVSRFKTRVATMAEMVKGEGRNQELCKTGFIGGQLVVAGLAEERWVREELFNACVANSYVSDDGDYEVNRVIDAAIVKGLESKPQRDNPIFGMALTSTELHALPSAKWLIDGVFMENSFNVIFGDPGCCKSFLAIAAAGAVANQGNWLGHNIPQNGKVVYILGEGASGLPDRVGAWEIHNGTAMDGVAFVPEAIHAGSKMWDKLVEYVTEERPALVIIDTLARMAGNMESENDAASMGKFIRACDDIRIASGGSVLVVHHANKMGGMRGSNALDGACDTIIRMDRDYSGTITASITKLKEGENAELGRFRLVSKGTSVVLSPGGVPWQSPSAETAAPESSHYE